MIYELRSLQSYNSRSVEHYRRCHVCLPSLHSVGLDTGINITHIPPPPGGAPVPQKKKISLRTYFSYLYPEKDLGLVLLVGSKRSFRS